MAHGGVTEQPDPAGVMGGSCRSMSPSPGWQWDTMRQWLEVCQDCVTGHASQQSPEHKHTSKIPNPKFLQPSHCHPSGLQSWHCRVTSSVQGAGWLLVEGTQIQPDAVSGSPGLGDIPDFGEGAGWGTPAAPGTMLGDTSQFWRAGVRLVPTPWPCWCWKAALEQPVVLG